MLILWHIHITAFAVEICNSTFSVVLSRYRIFKNNALVSSSRVKSPRRIFLGLFAEKQTPLLSQPLLYSPNLSPQTSSSSQNRNLVSKDVSLNQQWKYKKNSEVTDSYFFKITYGMLGKNGIIIGIIVV
jgi:predicted alpha/beta superfamily hydrolase